MPRPPASHATAESLDAPHFSPALRALAERGVRRSYRANTLLIQEGEYGDTLYIILEGQLCAFSRNDKGREFIHGIYGPGEYLGEMSLDGGPRSANVETRAASVCAVVTRTTLLEHIAAHPEFALELLSKVIRRARAATLSAKQLALNDVYARLKLLLESLAVGQDDGSWLVEERLTGQEIANRLGCAREMVVRVLGDLKRGGYVSTDGTRLRLSKSLPPRW